MARSNSGRHSIGWKQINRSWKVQVSHPTLIPDIKGHNDFKTNCRMEQDRAERPRNRLHHPSSRFRKAFACSPMPLTFHNPNFTGTTAPPGCGSPVGTVLGVEIWMEDKKACQSTRVQAHASFTSMVRTPWMEMLKTGIASW